MENQKPKITPLKNGPLLVKQLKRFSNSRGEEIETKPSQALCRCGASKTKPFCDGTHSSIGFSDEKLDSRIEDKKDTYAGKLITIHDNRGICSHAGFCTDNLPGVFRSWIEPWIDPEAADIEEIKRVIKMCPSGTLSFTEYAKVCGGFGIKVTKNEELEEAVINALKYNGPSIVEIISDPILT